MSMWTFGLSLALFAQGCAPRLKWIEGEVTLWHPWMLGLPGVPSKLSMHSWASKLVQLRQSCRRQLRIFEGDAGRPPFLQVLIEAYQGLDRCYLGSIRVYTCCEHLPVSRVVMYSLSLLVCFACMYKACRSATYWIKRRLESYRSFRSLKKRDFANSVN